jgi:hypothetical protein
MTRPDLPRCSVRGCRHAAGAVIDQALFCGAHAVRELKRVLDQRRQARLDDTERPRDET